MIKAKNFSSREELDNYILREKPEDVISGTRAELAKLNLSDLTTVHGVKCEITDTPTEIKSQKKLPERGEIHKGGINLKNK